MAIKSSEKRHHHLKIATQEEKEEYEEASKIDYNNEWHGKDFAQKYMHKYMYIISDRIEVK